MMHHDDDTTADDTPTQGCVSGNIYNDDDYDIYIYIMVGKVTPSRIVDDDNIYITRSPGALRAPTSSLRPFGPA